MIGYVREDDEVTVTTQTLRMEGDDERHDDEHSKHDSLYEDRAAAPPGIVPPPHRV